MLEELEGYLSDRSDLVKLTLQHSSLERVPTAVCSMTSLVILDISRNRLKSLLTNYCFTNSKGLMRFAADYNQIRKFEDRVFSGLQQL